MVTVQPVLAFPLLKPTVSTCITIQMHQARHVTPKECYKLSARSKKTQFKSCRLFLMVDGEICRADVSVEHRNRSDMNRFWEPESNHCACDDVCCCQ